MAVSTRIGLSGIFLFLVLLLNSCTNPGIESATIEIREISFSSGDVELAGELALPAVDGPVPAVLFVHASGVQPREWYYPLRDAFLDAGFATLIYDKRGSGKSGGTFEGAGYIELIADAGAALATLGEQDAVDPARIGIYGRSQGGFVAPVVARERGGVAFLVCAAGDDGSWMERNERRALERLNEGDYSETDLAEARAFLELSAQFAKSEAGPEQFSSAVAAARDKAWFDDTRIGRALVDGREFDPEFFQRFMAYRTDSAIDMLETLSMPILEIHAGRDVIFDSTRSYPARKAAIERSGNSRSKAVLFEEAGHLMRALPEGKTLFDLEAGEAVNYPYLEGYIDLIIEWTASVVGMRE